MGVEKTLFGVGHTSAGELQELLARIEPLRPQTAGLEISDFGITHSDERMYFKALYLKLRSSGTNVIPLSTREFGVRVCAFGAARYVVTGKLTVEELQNELSEYSAKLTLAEQGSLYTAPELRGNPHALRWHVDVHSQAIALLHGTPSPEQLQEQFRVHSAVRESTMLTVINATLPDVIVIGSMHAKALHPNLPQYRCVYLMEPIGDFLSLTPTNASI